jgi:hypothetical protein
MAVCRFCGVEAEVTITSDNKYSYTYPEHECCFWQDRASKPGGLQMFGKIECPHLVKAVDKEAAELKAGGPQQ